MIKQLADEIIQNIRTGAKEKELSQDQLKAAVNTMFALDLEQRVHEGSSLDKKSRVSRLSKLQTLLEESHKTSFGSQSRVKTGHLKTQSQRSVNDEPLTCEGKTLNHFFDARNS